MVADASVRGRAYRTRHLPGQAGDGGTRLAGAGGGARRPWCAHAGVRPTRQPDHRVGRRRC